MPFASDRVDKIMILETSDNRIIKIVREPCLNIPQTTLC